MENKINIAKLLKDCPSGMELDCAMFDNVYFEQVNEHFDYPIRIKIGKTDVINLTKYGCWSKYLNNAKCVIFPKGKTTWEGFQRPFVEGDIVFYNNTIAIFKEWGDETLLRAYVIKYLYKDCDTIMRDVPLFGKGIRKEIRFATEEEKQKLFQTIKDNGYKWNPETKTLEKLVIPIFKKGDKVRAKNGVSEPRIIEDVCDTFYTLVSISKIDFTDQDNWELVPDVKTKFKIEKGKWYVCIKDLLDRYANKAFCEGDTYYSPEDRYLIPSNSNVPSKVEYCTDEYFRDWTIQDAKDGDVLACNEEILLFKSYSAQDCVSLYCWYNGQTNNFHSKEVDNTPLTTRNKIYPATKEQCDLLFQKIKEAGYKWNTETKTLKKLVEPKFKIGDRIVHILGEYMGASGTQGVISEITDDKYIFNDGSYLHIQCQDNWKLVSFKVGNKIKDTRNNSEGIILKITDEGYECHFEYGNFLVSFKDQNNWELINELKFKVGDKIKYKNDKRIAIITGIKNDYYFIQYFNTNKNDYQNERILIKDQDQYELVPNKFDINTLVPFESKVLVRDTDRYTWEGAVFGRYNGNSFFTIGGIDWKYCIPYEGNEHLFGTTNDCDDFYKTWKE